MFRIHHTLRFILTKYYYRLSVSCSSTEEVAQKIIRFGLDFYSLPRRQLGFLVGFHSRVGSSFFRSEASYFASVKPSAQ